MRQVHMDFSSLDNFFFISLHAENCTVYDVEDRIQIRPSEIRHSLSPLRVFSTLTSPLMLATFELI